MSISPITCSVSVNLQSESKKKISQKIIDWSNYDRFTALNKYKHTSVKSQELFVRLHQHGRSELTPS